MSKQNFHLPFLTNREHQVKMFLILIFNFVEYIMISFLSLSLFILLFLYTFLILEIQIFNLVWLRHFINFSRIIFNWDESKFEKKCREILMIFLLKKSYRYERICKLTTKVNWKKCNFCRKFWVFQAFPSKARNLWHFESSRHLWKNGTRTRDGLMSDRNFVFTPNHRQQQQQYTYWGLMLLVPLVLVL